LAFRLVHELPRRLAFSMPPMPPAAAARWRSGIGHLPGVTRAQVWPRSGRAAVRYDGTPATRASIIAALDTPSDTVARRPASPVGAIARSSAAFLMGRALGGGPGAFLTLLSTLPYVARGARSLLTGRLDSAVLDGSAIGASLLSGDFASAALIGYLLRIGRHLEEATLEREADHFAELLHRDDEIWLVVDGGERRGSRADVKAGVQVVLRTGYVAPADGVLSSGEVLADLSWLTGEAFPRTLEAGDRVHEGARILDGHAVFTVDSAGPDTRLAHMVRIVETARRSKSAAESYAERLADRTVPWVLGLAALALAAGGDVRRARSILLVDYSCALKLTVPLTIHAGILSLADRHVLVKGGKWIERLARTDAVALDKTGTLTQGRPRVTAVVALNGYDRDFVLRNGACLEEHFTHPIARAIVEAAAEAGLKHDEERHGEVQFRVGRGVFSTLDGRRLVVAGRWILNEVDARPALERIAALEAEGHSLVYIVVGTTLAGVIAFDDPLRADAHTTLAGLRALGVGRQLLITGDEPRVAERVGRQLGLTDIHGGAFPDQKVELIRALQAQGRTVAMVGDGINDGPALSSADVGVSVANAADLSRETADVLLLSPGLEGLIDAVAVSRATIQRAHRTFRQVVAWNTTLLALGVLGLLTPARSALLHNLGTVLLSLRALRAPRAAAPSRPGTGQVPRVTSTTGERGPVAIVTRPPRRLRSVGDTPPASEIDPAPARGRGARETIPSARRRRSAGWSAGRRRERGSRAEWREHRR
jgi:heavy metal translocating P-type ATPase